MQIGSTPKTTPRAFSLEIRRVEVEAERRLAELHEMFSRQHEGARRALQNLLDGPLTFTQTTRRKGTGIGCKVAYDGRFFQRAVVSAMAASQGDSSIAEVDDCLKILEDFALATIEVAFVA